MLGEREYAALADIDPMGIYQSLTKLHVLSDDAYLRIQATNLGMVDYFITGIECDVLRELRQNDRTPQAAHFLGAQSQMWLFAAYELLRTWRQRANEIVKWSDNKGLEIKLAALQAQDQGYMHFGREMRIRQIQKVIDDPKVVPEIRNQLLHLHIPFVQLEYIRISLAKHEVRGKAKSAALMPGYGRINSWCGALDYELENGRYSMGYVNRRDVADGLRALDCTQAPPSDRAIQEFEDYMSGKGVPADPFG